VVEGICGRSWASCRGIELFARLKRMGLNTYLSAPKDDLKHRHIWLDLNLLKQKINQVMNLGCNAFALLFDDIDTNLN